MANLRKEANLTGAVNAADTAAKAVSSLGKGIWRGAKWLGGGKTPIRSALGGVGILAGGATLANATPELVRKGRQVQQEAAAPWQDRRMKV